MLSSSRQIVFLQMFLKKTQFNELTLENFHLFLHLCFFLNLCFYGWNKGRYFFFQLTVFRVLFPYWSDFCKFRLNLAADKILPTIERHRRRAKAEERRRQEEARERKEKVTFYRQSLSPHVEIIPFPTCPNLIIPRRQTGRTSSEPAIQNVLLLIYMCET